MLCVPGYRPSVRGFGNVNTRDLNCSPPPPLALPLFRPSIAFLDGGALSSEMTLSGLYAAAPRLAVGAQRHEERFQQEASGRFAGKRCTSWIDWYGEVLCDAEELKEKGSSSPGNSDYAAFKPLPFECAHAIPPSLNEPPFKIVLYADHMADSFAPIHAALLLLEPGVEYALLWARTARSGEGKGSLTDGYGVALDLKKTGYLVIGDRAHRSDDAASSTGNEDAGGNNNPHKSLP
ncbi:hypothetical protein CONPUDRAFT_159649 [Coniophora puteana RWD-64-598 SS2]|uniref:UGGT thioredoxin-like domain-containing protein n=1 Tax=Coniophora puteana (strain RWD-64-598) TaxID=741705 RepID=A0A5M3M7P7_CONPW|nr:uncharacterized protein CONPUDRAFT_159649 [Coniophora puteana RWD-64-598 SS2]EIW74874.1 hypothetical protein CONPUDRAFT_159649 [Coniophora puteana RWD-64-598 SS2]